ncbi:MAG: hypothetical protein ACTHKX_12765 [Pseudolysinimonas sp.]
MAEVDPRFDPVFQRGYDPARHGGRGRRNAPPPSPVAPRADASQPEAPQPEAPHPDAPQPDAPQTGEGAALAPDDVTLDDPPRPRIRYRLVLLVASIVSLLGAAGLIWQRITADPLDAYYGSNPGIMFRMQLVDALITPLMVAGLTGVILWLALGAMRGRHDA